jgi:hypothetical protein
MFCSENNSLAGVQEHFFLRAAGVHNSRTQLAADVRMAVDRKLCKKSDTA